MQTLNSSENNSNPEKNKRETITQLAHRHLRDQNHTTTDEELRNAVFELSENVHSDESLFEVDNTTITPPLPFEKNNNEADKGVDKNKNSSPNPYNILG